MYEEETAMVDMEELILKLFWILLGVTFILVTIETCSDEAKIKHIGYVSGYELVELEDGHQYLRVHAYHGRTLEHYIDCSKCKNNGRIKYDKGNNKHTNY